MKKRLISMIIGVSTLMLSSCGKQQGQPQAVTPPSNTAPPQQEDKSHTNPFLKIESKQELPFGAGTKATIWNLRGQTVKELTARMLICTDGKANNNNEISCRWDDASKPMNGQLVLLVQDGEPFGVKGKRLPSLSLSFPSGGPSIKTEKSVSSLIASDLPTKFSTAIDATSISGKKVLFAEVSLPQKEGSQSFSFSGSEDVLIEASKGGQVVLAVILEWKQ